MHLIKILKINKNILMEKILGVGIKAYEYITKMILFICQISFESINQWRK